MGSPSPFIVKLIAKYKVNIAFATIKHAFSYKNQIKSNLYKLPQPFDIFKF